MNKFISTGLWIVAAALTLASCTKSEPIMFGDIYGIVKGVDGEPIKAAEISLQPTGKSTVSGDTGDFEFNNLDAGQYSVTVSKSGYDSNTKTVKVVPGETARVDFMLAVTETTTGFDVSTSTLNFSKSTTTQTLDIVNTGNSDITWSVEDLPNWLTATPTRGTTAPGKSSALIVKADISRQSVSTSTAIRIVSGAESKSINVHLNIEEQNPLSINTNALYFAKDDSSKDFTITNVGATSVDFTIVNVPAWLTVTPKSGSIDVNASKVVNATIDRSKISSGVTATIAVTSGAYTTQLTVKVDVANSGSGSDEGSGSGSGSGGNNSSGRDFSGVEIIPCSDYLQFEITDCAFTPTGTVVLEYKVKNNAQNDIYMSASNAYSYAYDEDGNKFDVTSITFGSKEGNSSCTLPTGIVSKSFVTIPNVPKNCTKFSNVTISYYTGGVYVNLVFKNVPIYK